MSFGYNVQADSSDEDGAVDINAWKTGATRPRPASPPALSFQAVNQHVLPREPTPDLALEFPEEEEPEPEFRPAPQAIPKKKQEPVLVESDPVSEQEDDDEEQEVPRPTSSEDVDTVDVEDAGTKDDDEGEIDVPATGLMVALSPARIDEEEIEDFTAGDDTVRRVLREVPDVDGGLVYRVEFEDRHTEEIPFDDLQTLQNGTNALDIFTTNPPPRPKTTSRRSQSTMSVARPGRQRQSTRNEGYVNTADAVPLSGDESESEEDMQSSNRRGRSRTQDQTQYEEVEDAEESDEFEDESNAENPSLLKRLHNKKATTGKSLRSANRAPALDVSDEELIDGDGDGSDDGAFVLQSDLAGQKKRKARRSRASEPDVVEDEDGIGYVQNKRQRTGLRQSGRTTRHQGGMEEVDVDKIYRSDSAKVPKEATKPKPSITKEIFKQLPRNDEFRMRHTQQCEVCSDGPNFAPLIGCQGCTLAYHKQCLGHRTNRDHLVTKVGEGNFILQCRRCVSWPREKKENTAPDHGKCQDCHEYGKSCRPFRPRKIAAQEQKDREENEGMDPEYDVDESRINNAENVLFRCLNCMRGFHFEHLPSLSDMMDMDTEADADQRFREYSRAWKCKECVNMPAKVSGLIAWKPVDEDSYDNALAYDEVDEDDKAYLVRWEGMSYFRACWMPGAWVWGVTNGSMRKAFAKRDDSKHPKMRTEEAIPEDFLRADIVLDIKYTSIVDIRTEEIDKARIREVDKALIKYKGLGYEDAVWEKPPVPEDGERWSDFVVAYNDWVLGRYITPPRAQGLKSRLEKARKQEFAKLEMQAQPENLVGGELMKYQLEGLNWLFYKWYSQKNAILADEMGLGKTIQIIGFLATLVKEWNCFPFLVVVPNSTCPNWRREIKRWAPSLRVVAFYGSKESRDLAYRHELYPEGSKDMKAHIVVTSYDAAADDSCRKFFRGVQWQALIVDEGQRLKSEKTQLYSALGALKAPFKVLLTGTPLQNNQRELFNLLQWLDDSHNAAELEKQYEELDQAKIVELHELIRPFFLRRTKAQVLTFLPPMAQIILPVSMSIVQKKVYRTILANNPDLMRAIFSQDTTLKLAERASLSNILMQLRKCLCHPFVYSQSIEERVSNRALSHRNLVDASSKLKLLELLLPKLQERGHRVLIFSQFLSMLDMVEDFMDGMEMQYQRLDGTISALQKQKRIDDFNAPNSPLFAFLLSTRAGGVGINLASADTVIILDPDFNPHQDIQALSRAHRIGQQKKVLCFQLVTRASAEEKIMQIGRKKLALDHVLIQEMDADDANESDLVSVLRHGANELFDDNADQDITYDMTSVERLLDRSHMEDTSAGADKSAETQFSRARVWANNSGALQDGLVESENQAPDAGVWANILKERERLAAEEAAAKPDFGRGRRNRNNIDYAGDRALDGNEGLMNITLPRAKKSKTNDESDTDFQAEDESAAESGAEEGENPNDVFLDPEDREVAKPDAGRKKNDVPTFSRVAVPQPKPSTGQYVHRPNAPPAVPEDHINCVACRSFHKVGACPVKLAGVEYCNLCGIAHFGHARVCPHIQSETQVRAMIEALKHSNEPEHLVREATKYLKGLKGSLVQTKKLRQQKEHAAREAEAAAALQRIQAPYAANNNNGQNQRQDFTGYHQYQQQHGRWGGS